MSKYINALEIINVLEKYVLIFFTYISRQLYLYRLFINVKIKNIKPLTSDLRIGNTRLDNTLMSCDLARYCLYYINIIIYLNIISFKFR